MGKWVVHPTSLLLSFLCCFYMDCFYSNKNGWIIIITIIVLAAFGSCHKTNKKVKMSNFSNFFRHVNVEVASCRLKKNLVDVNICLFCGQRVLKSVVLVDWRKLLHITADGSTKYPPEAGRYHLYVSNACPFAHRALLGRKLKGLENIITLDVVEWVRTEKGWSFNPDVSRYVFASCK